MQTRSSSSKKEPRKSGNRKKKKSGKKNLMWVVGVERRCARAKRWLSEASRDKG